MTSYLLQGMEDAERFDILLSFTRIDSDDVKAALRDHLVKPAEGKPGGFSKTSAAQFNNVDVSNFDRALKRLNAVAAKVERVKEIDWAKQQSVK